MKPVRFIVGVALAAGLCLAPIAVSAAQAPGFLARTLNTQRGIPPAVSLAMYVGDDALEDCTALVLYFFSTSDPGWQGDLEFLGYSFNKLNRKGMRTIAVLMNAGAKGKVKGALRGIKFPVAVDKKRKISKRYGVSKAPGLFIVNSDAQITVAASGFEEDLDEFLTSAVKKTMRGQAVRVALGGSAPAPAAPTAPPPPPPPPTAPPPDSNLPSGDAYDPVVDEPIGRVVTPAPEPAPVAAPPPPEPPPPPPPPAAPRETPEEKQLKLYMPLEAGNQWEYFHRPAAMGDHHERLVMDIVAGAHRDFKVEYKKTLYRSETPKRKKNSKTWKLSSKGISIGGDHFLLKTPIRAGTAVGPRVQGEGTLKVADVGARMNWSGRRLNRCVEVASGGKSDTNREAWVFCPGVGLVEYTLYDAKLKKPRTFSLVRYQVGGKSFEASNYGESRERQVIRELRNGKRAGKLLAEGRKQVESNEYEKALENFSAINELFPKRGYLDANYWLGYAYLRVGLRKNNTGFIQQAAGALQAMLRENPGHDEAHYELGNTYMLLGKQKAAQGEWRKVQKGDLRKKARRSLRNPKQAFDDLKPMALVEEAHEHRKKGNLDDAIGLYGAIIKEYPSNEEAHLGLGLVFYTQNNLKASLKEFQAVLQINDDNRLAMNYVNLVKMKLSR